jgi:hypothetical protein
MFLLAAIIFFVSLGTLSAQTSSGSLHGQVTDPSGAILAQATVSVTNADGKTVTATTNRLGNYEFPGLLPGQYIVAVTAKGFSPNVQPSIEVTPGGVRKLDIQMAIEVSQEHVEVQGETTTVGVAPTDNAGVIVLKGKDLEALSDDPDELQSELQALAGPSAGPNGGQIYIDGFTGGELPPKSAIREIRINQNPFSAEFDKLGYGRIEILTKPGMDQYHGQFFFNEDNAVLNAANPFAGVKPAYQNEILNGNVGGPLSKKASVFFNVEQRNISDLSVVNAINPSTLTRFSQTLSNPRRRTNLTPRLDLQLGQNNTLTVRYQFTQNKETNDLSGPLALAAQAYNVSNTEQTLQISDTQVVSPRIVNETRFQYIRDRDQQLAQNFSPTISVLGAFTNGGNNQGTVALHQDHFELQNLTTMTLGKHVLKFGGRLRTVRDASDSTSGFNGMYTFASLTAYELNQPAQYSVTMGQPLVRSTLFDGALFVQDDWRLRPNMTLSYGLRLEGQNEITDHVDLAPRLGFAWGLGHAKTAPKTVVRAGFGIFYDRFTDNLVLQAERFNGINQQQFTIASPDFFPNAPAQLSSSPGFEPTKYEIDSRVHAPYTVQNAVSVERQLTKSATLSLTYLNSRGFDQLLAVNVNTPLPGTFPVSDAAIGLRPQGPLAGNIFQYESEGIFRENQLITNVNVRAGSKVSLFGYYALSYANSDTATAGATGAAGMTATMAGFPSNPYNLLADYGRASFDIRHRIFLGGTIALPYALRASPFIIVSSGQPFNITQGEDLNGDSIFNDRPIFALPGAPADDVVSSPWGDFDKLAPPTNAAPIPINLGTASWTSTVNLRISKTIGFGRKLDTTATQGPRGGMGGGGRGGQGGAPGGGLGPRGLSGAGGGPGGAFGAGAVNRRYNLTFSVAARNLLNHLNAAPPVGNVNSPLFGLPNALAGGPFNTASANRRVDLQLMFSF